MSIKRDAKSILFDQFDKVATFIYILIFLFIVFLFFKLNYSWKGITEITNVFLFFLSFFIIFNFSRIDLDRYKKQFEKNYGKKGLHALFITTRIVPFLFIYSVTVIFTLINYLDRPDWPWRPLLDLLNGRFSNVVFYSLILLVILKIRKEPRITIPLFILLSVIYYIIYQLVHVFFESGLPVSFLKLFQIIVAAFFLINEFFFEKAKTPKPTVIAIISGTLLYFIILWVYVMAYNFSAFGSFSQIKSCLDLLERGHRFPLVRLQEIIINKSRVDLVRDFINYSKTYRKDVDLSGEEWGMILQQSPIPIAEVLCEYIAEKNIVLAGDEMAVFALATSEKSGKELLEAKNVISYSAKFADMEKILRRFNGSNSYYRIWAIRILSQAKEQRHIPFLINIVAGMDKDLADEAYRALKEITGRDPARETGLNINSPRVLKVFSAMQRSGTAP